MDIHDLNQGEMIELLGISRPTIINMAKEVPPIPCNRGEFNTVKYDLHKVLRWLIDRAVRKAGLVSVRKREAQGAQAVPEIAESEARKMAALASMAELKLARDRGELIHLSDYERAWAVRIQRHKEGMAAIKARVSARVGHEVAKIVDDEIRVVMGSMDQIQLPEGA